MTQFKTPGFIEGKADKNESLEVRRKRLKFRSWHRGIKEADILLGSFADNFLDQMSLAEIDTYENLLREADSDLVAWITGEREPPKEHNTSVMQKLRSIDYIKILK